MYIRNGDQELSLRKISCIRQWLLHNIIVEFTSDTTLHVSKNVMNCIFFMSLNNEH